MSARDRPTTSNFGARRIAGLVLAATGGWVLMAAPASASGQSRNLEVRVDTLANGRVVVSNPDLAAVGEGRTLELVEELRIGAGFGTDADAPELFGKVISLAVDEDERRCLRTPVQCLRSVGTNSGDAAIWPGHL